jgi:hypothetical protein
MYAMMFPAGATRASLIRSPLNSANGVTFALTACVCAALADNRRIAATQVLNARIDIHRRSAAKIIVGKARLSGDRMLAFGSPCSRCLQSFIVNLTIGDRDIIMMVCDGPCL